MKSNMGPNFGGIGGGGERVDPDIDPVVGVEVPRRMVPRDTDDLRPQPLPESGAPAIAAEIERNFAQINDTIGRILTDTSAFGERLYALEQALNQTRGQINQLEANHPQIVQAFQGVDARIRNHDQALQDIARRFSANLRLAALDAAVKGKGPGERHETVLKAAEMFLSFLEPKAAPGAVEGPEEPEAERTVN